ncbi:exonuclease [Sinorhizobium phage phiM7]|uniref:Exonuclease n=2 Tax=Emdodecavirus TaxID=1980937 RepID=A0A0F6SJ27_9CAUD|nr:exonuclease [Sinorhizobium phage phiN3]YP_009601323.1 exonuclease [Sinorhizobium phage phiM7]AKF12743.1 exonuclease [Sinorhizobium phage phiM7]AKF13103.1 exonuclease [Sinorhizobium phage phiM19]AKF13473.1 exonuclease [Sinorhizobium phage phiN3]
MFSDKLKKEFRWVEGVPELQDISADTTENGRFYTCPDGSIYPSVTTILSIVEKEGLTAWKERVGEAEAKRVMEQAAVRGTAVHDMAEKYLRGENWRKGQMPGNIGSFLPIQKALYDHVDDIYYIEAPLYSKFLRTAGRVDLVARWKGIKSIIDFKTSRINKDESMIDNYFMQESAYAVMIEERIGMPIQQLVTIMTSDDSPTPLIFVKKRDDYIGKFMEYRKLYDQQKQESTIIN